MGVDGILAIISTPQQAVGHLNLQQVVQHLRLVPDGLHCVQQFHLVHAEVMRDEGVESVGGIHKLSLCAMLVNKLKKKKIKKTEAKKKSVKTVCHAWMDQSQNYFLFFCIYVELNSTTLLSSSAL